MLEGILEEILELSWSPSVLISRHEASILFCLTLMFYFLFMHVYICTRGCRPRVYKCWQRPDVSGADREPLVLSGGN